MKKEKRDYSKNRIQMTDSILQTFVLALFILTLITTALSMAKYAVTQSSEQLALVNSSKFIFTSDLVTSGSTNQDTITGELLTKTSYTLSDAYVPMQIKNYESANGTTNINGEDILFKISVTGNIKVQCVTDPLVPQDVNGLTNTMVRNMLSLEEYQILPDGTDPGVYEGSVTVESLAPYIKKYVRDVKIEMKDVTVSYREDEAQLYVEIQNGIKDNVTVEFQYLEPIYEMNVNVPASVTVVKNESVSPRKVVLTLPAGVKASIQFRCTNVVLRASDVTYIIP